MSNSKQNNKKIEEVDSPTSYFDSERIHEECDPKVIRQIGHNLNNMFISEIDTNLDDKIQYALSQISSAGRHKESL